jgi:hypothetical protein
MRRTLVVLALVAASFAASGCKKRSEPSAPPPPPPSADAVSADAAAVPAAPDGGAADAAATAPEASVPEAAPYGALSRDDFNRLAARLDLPLFWRIDQGVEGIVEPDEVVGLLFYRTEGNWVDGGAFTPAFDEAYAAMRALAAHPEPRAGLPPEELQRRRLIDEELDQGYPTLVFNDLAGLAPDEKTLLVHLLAAGKLVDELYAVQTGATALAERVLADDPASARAFGRNWGAKCLAPRTENQAACSAVPGAPKQLVDCWPAPWQADDGFCATRTQRPDAERLTTPFTVVRAEGEGDAVKVVPLTEAYGERMKAVAAELRAAADAVEARESEAALRAYLRAAADGFESNAWEPADEAWSRMNAENSAWYVRVAPDEVYWEPCAQKAGFHMTLARINTGSLQWQQKLVPVQQEMEDALAALAGAPYASRRVTFHFPDFIDIVTNHGDDRDPAGATIGQSLPNWGPVANEGRGRTVVMTNLYTDPDSLRVLRNRVAGLLDAASAGQYSDDQQPNLLGTILHEAAHNLGPSHEYAVDGKKDDDAFGGPLATVMEELKAQTAALWYVDFLLGKGLITPEFARQSYAASIAWCFGHISRGMWTAARDPKPYSQLSAIQIGMLLELGAMKWDPAAVAANGTDVGALVIDFAALPAAVNQMMQRVGAIKATGDRAAAEALVAKYVDGDTVPQATIRERVLRDPKATFVYALVF